MKILVKINNQAIDIYKYHEILYRNSNSQSVTFFLSEIEPDTYISLINEKNYRYDFSGLLNEMNERYNLIFLHNCKSWNSSELDNAIKPKIIIINLDFIKKSDLNIVITLFQIGSGSGIYLILGYSKRKPLYKIFDSAPLIIKDSIV